jgi:tetratricopeptide (TPR) repeat protein
MVKPFRNWLNHSSLAALLPLALAACATASPAAAPGASGPLEKKLGQDPNDRALNVQLGAEAEAHGELLRAEQYYLRAEALGAPPAEIVPRLLRVLVQAHRYQEALERCRARLAVTPDDRATRFVAAALLVATDKPKEAERELDQLVRARPDDAQAYLALGKLYRDGYNDPARAKVMFEKFLALAPNDPSAAAIRFEIAEPAPAPLVPSEATAK